MRIICLLLLNSPWKMEKQVLGRRLVLLQPSSLYLPLVHKSRLYNQFSIHKIVPVKNKSPLIYCTEYNVSFHLSYVHNEREIVTKETHKITCKSDLYYIFLSYKLPLGTHYTRFNALIRTHQKHRDKQYVWSTSVLQLSTCSGKKLLLVTAKT